MIKLDVAKGNHLKDITIMYVDDDKNALEIVTSHLDEKVKKIYTYSDPQEAIEAYKKIRVDIVLSDIRMPSIDGFEMVRRIREISPSVKVIYTSAYSSKDNIIKSIKDSADDFMQKPILGPDLLSTLDKVATLLLKNRKIQTYTKFVKLILDSQENLVVVTNDEEMIDCNQQVINFFGYPSFQNLKNEYSSINKFFIKDRNFIYEKDGFSWLDDVLLKQPAKVKMKNHAGKEHIFLLKCTPFIMEDKNPHYIVTFTDITMLEENKKRLQTLSLLDPLTGVYNRVHFNHLLKKYSLMYKKDKKEFSIILIDIDNFRSINETFGYIAGDKILVDIAYELKKMARKDDILARWSGEEFVLLLPHTTKSKALDIAKNINEYMDSCDFSVDKCGECSFTCSIVVTSSKSGDDENSILHRVENYIKEQKDKSSLFVEL
jgi:diguanylate cyclase (GGDEF)-like protein